MADIESGKWVWEAVTGKDWDDGPQIESTQSYDTPLQALSGARQAIDEAGWDTRVSGVYLYRVDSEDSYAWSYDFPYMLYALDGDVDSLEVPDATN